MDLLMLKTRRGCGLLAMIGLLSAPGLGGATQDRTMLTVRVQATGFTDADTEAYVAVVPSGSETWRPVAEALNAGIPDSVTLEVPAGVWDVLCSATGHAPTRLESVSLSPGDFVAIECVMDTLVRLTGRVLSGETGREIEGATIAPLSVLTEPVDQRLSELGRQHIRRTHMAYSQRDGTFSLPVLPDRTTDIVVEAPGAAFEVLEDVSIPESGGSLSDIVLRPGGSLEVLVDLPAGAARSDHLVSLARFSWEDGFRYAKDSPERTLLRRLVGEQSTVRWPSLPEGVYAVTLEQRHGEDRPAYSALVDVRPFGAAFAEVGIASARVSGTVHGLPAELAKHVELSIYNQSQRVVPDVFVVDRESHAGALGFTSPELILTGRYDINVSFTDSTSQVGATVGAIDVNADSIEIEESLDLAGGPFGGLVIDGNGRGVDGAAVTVTDEARSYSCRTTTGFGGRWECPWVDQRRVFVIARHPTIGVSELRTIDTVPNAAAPTDLILSPGRTLTGCVAVPYGFDPGGARVGFSLTNAQGVFFETATDTEGRFELLNMPRGAARILIRPKQRDLAFAVVSVGDDESGEFACVEVGPGGIAIAPGPSGGTWNGVLRSALVWAGCELGDLYPRVMGRPPCLAPGAQCLLDRLRPGEYKLRWDDGEGGHIGTSPSFWVSAGDVTVFSTDLIK